MTWGIFKADSVSEAYKKMKAEELKGKQHKLDVNKNGKIDGEDLSKLRKEETVEEGWDDMLKHVKDKSGPQPNGGSGKKQGTRYGGGKQKEDESEKRKEKNESVEDAKESILDEEADLVKTGSKEIKHANVKDKQDDQDDFGPRAQGEKDFLDKLSVQVTDDPARDGHKTGADRIKPATKPVAKGAGSYDGDSKLSSKDKASFKESASEDDIVEENVDEACSSSKGKKTYTSFKAKIDKKGN